MPEPFKRARHKKQIQKKTSGGRTVTHYRTEKPSFPICSNCGQQLAGLPTQKVSKISKLSQTQKKVTRMYSGTLCPNCLQNSLRDEARKL